MTKGLRVKDILHFVSENAYNGKYLPAYYKNMFNEISFL